MNDYKLITTIHDVELRAYSDRTLAVLCFTGAATDKNLAAKQKDLHNTIYRAGIKEKGEPFLLSTTKKIFAFLNKNELAVEV